MQYNKVPCNIKPWNLLLYCLHMKSHQSSLHTSISVFFLFFLSKKTCVSSLLAYRLNQFLTLHVSEHRCVF